MAVELKKLLIKIDNQSISIPQNLVNNIVLRMDEKARHNSKIKALGLSLVSISSFLLSIPIIFQIITSFTQSGLYNYLSLISTDSDVLVRYWKDIAISLAESLPVLGIASLLAVLAVFVWSALKARSEVRNSLSEVKNSLITV